MSKVTVPMPAELAPLISNDRDGVTLTGPDGKPAGHVLSPDVYEMLCNAADMWFPPLPTREQLDEAERRGGEHPMEEVWKLVGEG